MTNKYDFSTYTVKEMNFEFANLSVEQANEKRKLYEQYIVEKEEAKRVIAETVKRDEADNGNSTIVAQEKPEISTSISAPVSGPIKMPVGLKPVFKPVIKLPENKKDEGVENEESPELTKTAPAIKMPVGIRPVIKPIIKKPELPQNE